MVLGDIIKQEIQVGDNGYLNVTNVHINGGGDASVSPSLNASFI